MKTPPAPCAEPESAFPVTAGARPSAADPFTVKALSAARAWVPRPSAASLDAASLIVPLFSPSAEAATAIPFASVSAATTV